MRKFLLSLMVLVLAATSSFSQADSLGIKKEGDKYFVIHKVMSGQTLYSLARRYGTTVTEIKAKNAELVNDLKVGQTINIPYGKPMGQAEIPTKNSAQAAKNHTVAAGETLFAISQKYGVDVNEIKKLNGLTSNALAVGQTLKISVAAKTTQEVTSPTTTTTEKPVAKPIEKPKVTDTTQKVTNPVSTGVEEIANESYNGSPFNEIVEEGQAELIIEDESSTKFLALHKTAKVGTVIKVKNRMNNLTVYVRVVGEIPDTADNQNILIKLNKRAYDQLKALDNRFLVELSYFQ
ncbi:LysM peptidoglycan-binding domain-containing protein [Roseivirga seohaensis]|nr:LysM peptidoglycan-binding domain-containing protein [Roseivirga seohaensis]